MRPGFFLLCCLAVFHCPLAGVVLQKKKFRANPSGNLLITPYSLESLLINSSGWLTQAFSSVAYVVITLRDLGKVPVQLLPDKRLPLIACVLTTLVRMNQYVFLGLRRHTAIRRAFRAIAFVIRDCIDQPVISRKNRSTTTASYSQSS